MILHGPTFHVTPVDLGIIFQCNLYMLISCIMCCGNKIVSNAFTCWMHSPIFDTFCRMLTPVAACFCWMFAPVAASFC